MEKTGDPLWEIGDRGSWGTWQGDHPQREEHLPAPSCKPYHWPFSGSDHRPCPWIAFPTHSPLGTPIPLCVTALMGYLDKGWGAGGSPEGRAYQVFRHRATLASLHWVEGSPYSHTNALTLHRKERGPVVPEDTPWLGAGWGGFAGPVWPESAGGHAAGAGGCALAQGFSLTPMGRVWNLLGTFPFTTAVTCHSSHGGVKVRGAGDGPQV